MFRDSVLEKFSQGFGVTKEIVKTSPFYKEHSTLSISEQNKVVKAYILSFSLNTIKKYANASYDFFKKSKSSLPLKKCDLNLFLINEAEKGRSYNSLENSLLAFKFISNFLSFPNDHFSTKQIQMFLKKFCKKTCRRRDGFQKTHLNQLWTKINEKGGYSCLTKCQLRTFVMLVFCYSTLARFDCTSNIKIEHLTFEENVFKITVPKSKTDQEGNGQRIYLLHESVNSPHRLLCDYIRIFDLDCDYFLFPPLKWDMIKKSWIPEKGKSISYSSAYVNFKKLLTDFGFTPDFLSMHSPRIGSTTDMFQAGVKGYIIDKRGRWKDPKTKFTYAKDSENHLIQKIRRSQL